jgi:hypothetical protein
MAHIRGVDFHTVSGQASTSLNSSNLSTGGSQKISRRLVLPLDVHGIECDYYELQICYMSLSASQSNRSRRNGRSVS